MRALRYVESVVKNRLGRVPAPAWCTYLVTYRCNARCGMCDSWKLKAGNQLSTEQAVSVFEKLGPLDVVRLSGGEPFLRPDLLAIAEGIQRASSPLVLHVSTNGSLPDEVAAFATAFSHPNRLHIMVSLDGDQHEHDRNRGPRARFALATDTIRRLVRIRKRRPIGVSVNYTVISQRSLEDAPQVKREMALLGVDVHSVVAYSDSAMYSKDLHGTRADRLIRGGGYPLHEALSGLDTIGFVKREIDDLGGLRSWVTRQGKRYYLEGLADRLANGNRRLPQPRCVALRSHVRLLPDGSVPVCQFNTETIGNLSEQSVDAVLGGERAIEARHWVDRCPGCWAECEVIPSAVYSGALLAPQSLIRPRV